MSAPVLVAEQLEIVRGAKHLCRNVSFGIRPGQFWGVLGENGSGKTSLLHTLAGLELPAQGGVRLFDKPLREWPRKLLARNLGLLPQQRQESFPLKVEEAIAAGRFPHRSFWQSFAGEETGHIAEALDVVGLKHKRGAFLHELSGGEQQRAAIATLLVQEPTLFLLDEPCNHLDVRHQVKVLNHFQQLAIHGQSVLMALHDVNLAARYCTHLVLLFPSGETLVGESFDLLTEANLSRLFSHPIREVSDGRDRLWLPV